MEKFELNVFERLNMDPIFEGWFMHDYFLNKF